MTTTKSHFLIYSLIELRYFIKIIKIDIKENKEIEVY